MERAKGPVLNLIEMAMRTEKDVADQLKAVESCRAAFAGAFPGEADPVTFHSAARTIAALERTLVAPARFDRYLNGEMCALTKAEKQGLVRFVDAGCTECHNSHPVGGRIIEELGAYHRYANTEDLGRYEVTHNENDRYVFKVPMLRNAARTHPYLHDGAVSTLPGAVWQMACMQPNKELAPAEIDEIMSSAGAK